jgi:hypothetical protein
MSSDDEATLLIQVKASLSDFSAKMGEFEAIIGKGEDKTEKLGKSWQETAKGFIAGQFSVDAIKKVFGELVGVIKEGVAGVDEQVVAMVQLRATLGDGADAIKEYADRQQELTRFEDDDTLAAANSLAIHKLNREEIEKLLPVIQDFAAFKGRSAAETAEAFGRAIQFGTTRGLQPFGIEIEKNGSQLEIYNAIVDAGKGKINGMAEEMGKAGLGPVVILQNQIADLKKELASEFLPTIQTVATWMKDEGIPVVKAFMDELFGETRRREADQVKRGVVIELQQNLITLQGAMKDAEESGSDSFVTISKSGTYLTYTIEEARKQIALLNKEIGAGDALFGKGGPAPGKPAPSKLGTAPISGGGGSASDKQRDAILDLLDVGKAQLSANMAEIDSLLRQGRVSIDEWYKDESAAIKGLYNDEVAAQNKIIKIYGTSAEAQKARNAIAKIDAEFKQKQIALSEKYAAAIKKEKDAEEHSETIKGTILGDAEGRGSPKSSGLEKQFKIEESQRKKAQAKELADFKKLGASKREQDDLTAAHERENAQKTHEFVKSLKASELELARTSAAALVSIANDLYQMTGEKSIALFNLSKVAAIASATINTFEGVTKAIAQGGVYGIATGILVGIAGGIQIAKIAATEPPKMEVGGPIDGPSHAAGGVTINAEGGEFMHRRSAVQLYGTAGMDAINRGLIPPSVIRSYAGGAPAAAAGAGGRAVAGGSTVRITNIQDPRMIDRHMASSEGKSSYINFLGKNKTAVRQALGV